MELPVDKEVNVEHQERMGRIWDGMSIEENEEHVEVIEMLLHVFPIKLMDKVENNR